MHKLPIVETAAGTIGFAFRNMFTAIRLGWVGLLLFIIIYGIGIALVFGSMGDFIHSLDYVGDDPEQAIEAICAFYGTYFSGFPIFMLAGAMFIPLYVIMIKMAAGEAEAPEGFAYFKFGGNEVRIIFGYILAFLAYSIVSIGAFLPAMIAFGIGVFSGVSLEMFEEAATNPEALEQAIEANVAAGSFGMSGVIAGLLLVVGIVLFIWFAIRMVTFIPSIAAENRIALFDALRMTKGNVWRIIGAAILYFVLLMLTIIAIEIGLVLVAVLVGFIYSLATDVSEILGYAIIAVGGVGGLVLLAGFFGFMISAEIGFPGYLYKGLKDNA